jgi:hypothetical protein
MATPPTKAEVRAALLHLVEVAACFERAEDHEGDREAVRLLSEAVALAGKHRQARAQEEAQTLLVGLAGQLADLYREVQSGQIPHANALDDRLVDLFDAHHLALHAPDAIGEGAAAPALDELSLTADEIGDAGGPTDAAMKALSRVSLRGKRTLYLWKKGHPLAVAPTAFNLRLGREGMRRYIETLLDDVEGR